MTEQKKRLALFMTGLAGGGAERIMLTLADAFARTGHEVDLVVCRAKGALRCEVPENVRLVDLGAPRIIASLPALIGYLKRERPAAMLSAMSPANCIATWARKLSHADTRLVLAEHNTLSQASTWEGGYKAKLLPILMRWSYLLADQVVAVSQGVADDLALTIGLPREQISVIYNPVITPSFWEKVQVPLEHPWFASGQPPVILGVGRLTRQKDFPCLIRAFSIVREHHPTRLMILGEGEERPLLDALVSELGLQEDVLLPGFVSNPYPYMRQSRVFVLSSRWEGLPTVLIEAMASGTDVLSTDCPSGPREILGEQNLEKLTEIENQEMLAEKILWLLNHKKPESLTIDPRFTLSEAVSTYLKILDFI